MPVITIRGQMGSGAPEIGKQIASKLNIDYIDREIIAQVAKETKSSNQKIEDKETPPNTLLGRIAEALASGAPLSAPAMTGGGFPSYMPVYEIPLDDTSYITGLETVIKKLAHNRDVVIRGRGSQFILKDSPGSFHVMTVASEDVRIKRIMSSLGLSEADARKEVSRSDGSHREFIKRYFKKELEDPINYDIVINTSSISDRDAAAIIMRALEAKTLANSTAK